ncbi:MAG: LuxR C-terminal-related transcriptional regulator [Chloroflexota bacterium]|nr:LuxR C-terminal-related transcriptional regulator [Chloroflexota bacterium]
MADKESPLSKREQEVLELVATGATNRQIARELYISVNTVKVHLRNVFNKLEVSSRTEATVVALREGWVAVEGVVTEDEAVEAPKEVVRFEPLPVESLPWPRRIFLALAAVLLLALLAWVRMPASHLSSGSSGEFTDHPMVKSPALPAEAPRWQERMPMTLPRARLALALYKDQLYAIGGDTPNGIACQVSSYDLRSDIWASLADKPTPTANIKAVLLSDRIYVPGGYTADGEVADVLEIYDPQADQWSSAAPLPEPRCAYGLTLLEGQLYLLGGWDGSSYVDTVYSYDPRADAWSEEAPLRAPRGFLGAATLAGRIYAVGGYDGAREYRLCEVYDPQGGWSSCAPMRVGRGGLEVAAVGGRLYAIGGGISGKEGIFSNEWYDPHQDGWTSFRTPFNGQWHSPGVATDGTSIFAVGGWSRGYLAKAEEYQALYRLFLPAAP